MRPGHIVVFALVAVLGLAAVFVAQPWLGQRSHSNPAPVGLTAVDSLAKNVEESFQAIENRINQRGQEFQGTQDINGFCGCRPYCVDRSIAEAAVLCRGHEFRGTQPIDTEAMPFDPNARVKIIRGMSAQEYDVPSLKGEENYECAAARPRHPFAGRHPCFPEQ